MLLIRAGTLELASAFLHTIGFAKKWPPLDATNRPSSTTQLLSDTTALTQPIAFHARTA
jgi:hypothetical protein